MYAQAEEVLRRHGYGTSDLAFVGAGAQSACYGTDEVAVLLSRSADADRVADLTGHVVPGSEASTTCNNYAVLRWLATRAADAGVRTPRFLAVGEEPRPYAVVERATGILAADHPRVAEHATAWFGQLGEELARTHLVRTTGFGMFVPDGAGGYRGRFGTWVEYLDNWLGVHLCVGRSRPEDQKVLDLFLAQGIVTEGDLALVAAKVREAQEWPVASVLTHYDNRLDNLVVDSGGAADTDKPDGPDGPDGAGRITVLDWGLSLAGIGIAQELIKLFETEPTSVESPRVAAFLRGYGLSLAEAVEAVERGKLMLVMDGLGMSYGWADDPDRLGGIRAWLRTVSRLCREWA
ncbi:Phosphotransferase enzyme family protein [Actinopolymorpha singaporensis]|uniref:Phosphotransferase enzyme family protein n=2 Tax=Actinopolymorpha singaporensis TaxID=117157 RepID=A0A1H1RE87_9ACTN|nr:Phosphotransferase enzyme family protein [Actinopolymorpha singaporensis]